MYATLSAFLVGDLERIAPPMQSVGGGMVWDPDAVAFIESQFIVDETTPSKKGKPQYLVLYVGDDEKLQQKFQDGILVRLSTRILAADKPAPLPITSANQSNAVAPHHNVPAAQPISEALLKAHCERIGRAVRQLPFVGDSWSERDHARAHVEMTRRLREKDEREMEKQERQRKNERDQEEFEQWRRGEEMRRANENEAVSGAVHTGMIPWLR